MGRLAAPKCFRAADISDLGAIFCNSEQNSQLMTVYLSSSLRDRRNETAGFSEAPGLQRLEDRERPLGSLGWDEDVVVMKGGDDVAGIPSAASAKATAAVRPTPSRAEATVSSIRRIGKSTPKPRLPAMLRSRMTEIASASLNLPSEDACAAAASVASGVEQKTNSSSPRHRFISATIRVDCRTILGMARFTVFRWRMKPASAPIRCAGLDLAR